MKTKIYSRDKKEHGWTPNIHSTRECRMEGCCGNRIYVKWVDGSITYPCTTDLTKYKDGFRLA